MYAGIIAALGDARRRTATHGGARIFARFCRGEARSNTAFTSGTLVVVPGMVQIPAIALAVSQKGGEVGDVDRVDAGVDTLTPGDGVAPGAGPRMRCRDGMR